MHVNVIVQYRTQNYNDKLSLIGPVNRYLRATYLQKQWHGLSRVLWRRAGLELSGSVLWGGRLGVSGGRQQCGRGHRSQVGGRLRPLRLLLLPGQLSRFSGVDPHLLCPLCPGAPCWPPPGPPFCGMPLLSNSTRLMLLISTAQAPLPADSPMYASRSILTELNFPSYMV